MRRWATSLSQRRKLPARRKLVQKVGALQNRAGWISGLNSLRSKERGEELSLAQNAQSGDLANSGVWVRALNVR